MWEGGIISETKQVSFSSVQKVLRILIELQLLVTSSPAKLRNMIFVALHEFGVGCSDREICMKDKW
jgi:hypothetical protein